MHGPPAQYGVWKLNVEKDPFMDPFMDQFMTRFMTPLFYMFFRVLQKCQKDERFSGEIWKSDKTVREKHHAGTRAETTT